MSVMYSILEGLHVNEAASKDSFIGNAGKGVIAIKIKGVSVGAGVGTPRWEFDNWKKIKEFRESAKQGSIGVKGKSSILPSIKEWIKTNNPSEYYGKWEKPSSAKADDVLTIYYRD